MSSPPNQFDVSSEMGIYEPFHQVCMWGDTYKVDGSLNGAHTNFRASVSMVDNSELIPTAPSQFSGSDQEDRPADKVQRRLAQNREAARRSRLRKKAYVKQLETSRLKLVQLELELQKNSKTVRPKSSSVVLLPDVSIYMGGAIDATSHMGISGTVETGLAAFEFKYKNWVEEQNRKNCELRNALQAHIPDIQIHILVESCLNHYRSLFQMKAEAAKADVFYLISGAWRTSVERFFLWIGGLRPSQLLNIVLPQLEPPLSEQQLASVKKLLHSSQQAEDALTQGLDKLQQTLAESIAFDTILAEDYGSQIASPAEKLEAFEGFVNQADHLRQQTLQYMSRILTPQQAARGLLTLGEYLHRLRVLSSAGAGASTS